MEETLMSNNAIGGYQTGHHASHGEYDRISKKGNLVRVDPATGKETTYSKTDGHVIGHGDAHHTDHDVYVPRGSDVRESHHGNLVVDRPTGSETTYNKQGDVIDHKNPVQFYDPQPTVYVKSNSW
jgi:hypothetical protein